MGRLERIWVKRFHRGPMDRADAADLRRGAGIVGNANQGGWRQVTIVAAADWDRVVEALGTPVDPGERRANLLVSGVALAHTRDRVLQVGGCRLRVRGETRPCERMDEAEPGLRAALDPGWRGGVFAEVLDDGRISVGDPVAWAEPAP
ncbi:MAG: MOSC domain-containing protein [Acidobacteria bacterium]|nr:MOSC domain-containing protein [Acidobacteriota bacterium]